MGRGLLRVPLCALLRHAGVGSWGQVQPPLPLPCRRSSCGWGRPPGPGGAEGRAWGSPAGVGAGGGGGGGGGGGATPLALGPVWEGGGGGSGGGPSVPWRCPLSARKGGGRAAWRSQPRGPAIGQGGRALPPPPSTECRIPTQSLPGAPLLPAVAARRWPAGGGRESQRSVVSGLRGRFPRVGNKAGVPWRRAVHGGAWPPIPFRSAPTRLLWARSARRPGAQAWARMLFAAPIGAGGWGVGAGHSPAPLPGGGVRPFSLGGVGAGAPAAGGPVGGRGGGGCRAAASLLSFQAAACGTPSWLSPRRRCAPFRRALAVGAEVPPRGGGGEGRPVDRHPGGPI